MNLNLHRALFYQEDGKGFIRCGLCPHNCRLGENSHGICGVREVRDGTLYSLNYGLCAAIASDPVEKKPLYHFYPGRAILSLGTFGCNFSCLYCQNWSLARSGIPFPAQKYYRSPEDIIKILRNDYPGSLGIAYTYNEPTVWYEYILDTAALVKSCGYKNVLVTNGFISRPALERLIPYIDALNIDVKSFSNAFYQKYCGGLLQAVKETLMYSAERCHLEVTYMVIPTLNDSFAETDLFTDWLSSVNPQIPLHFSRYFPAYKFTKPPTPVHTLTAIRERALKKMCYVYIGNLGADNRYANTYCPSCGNLLITRDYFSTAFTGLDPGKKCHKCGKEISLLC